jgi:flagellar biosynthesis protein FlhG
MEADAMSKVVALLSGKGGSGKTSLALSISALLTRCKLKVLLIDSDLCTNGVTYFYENRLNDGGGVCSFYDVFVKGEDLGGLVHINEYMDFMPSITKIAKSNADSYMYIKIDSEFAGIANDVLSKDYDVVIYDCQAGYTDWLKVLLPMVDIGLFVMEADAISSAAIRSLYLKIGYLLNDKKVYQVFNKATEEEYKVYSKISGGMVFTNIETVMFDWKIRKAFALSHIPDLENTSARYGEQIYNICLVLFNEKKMVERLERFSDVIELNKIKDEEMRISDKMNAEVEEQKTNRNRIIKALTNLVAPCMGFLSVMVFLILTNGQGERYIEGDNIVITVLVFLVGILVMAVVFIYIFDVSKERDGHLQETRACRQRLDDLSEKRKGLESRIAEYRDS